MKTPDEIKKGLEYLSITNVAEKVERFKQGLPYAYTEEVAADALALIQQLELDKQQLEGLCNHMNQLRDAAAGRALKMEERVKRLEAERDAAVADLKTVCQLCAVCCACKDHDEGSELCERCFNATRWQWRGVQKEESDDGR